MKAITFLPTLLLLCSSWGLPKLNKPAVCGEAGKIIKAETNSTDFLTLLLNADTLGVPELVISRKKGSSVKTVVIDPGHGGHDPGCHGSSAKEKHVCLAIGKYFAAAIQQNFPDVKVIMTRSTDVFIPLHERAAIATRNKADLFISIHCNAILNASKTMGTETYVLGLHATEANLEVAKRENESILYEENYKTTYDGYDPNSPEAHIMFSMLQNAFLEQSLNFANKVQQHSYSVAKRKNRGVKQAGFLVLRHATMPSVLVETGFLTNVTEEAFLRTKGGQKSMANALLLAFGDYKAEMEGATPPPLALIADDADSEEINITEDVVSASQEAAYVKPVKQSVETQPTNTKPEKNQPLAQAALPKSEPPTEYKVTLPPDRAPNKVEPTGPPPKILVEKPIAEMAPPKEKPKAQNAGIQYRVQLAASPKQMDITKGKWANVDYLIQVIEENNLYKYQVVNFASQEEAADAKTKLRAIGFSDAFVVSYQNGIRL